jgi:hypothetical protein
VTTLIGAGVPKPALLKWAPKRVAEYVADNLDEHPAWQLMGREELVKTLKETPWRERDAAGNKGSEVHRLAEALTKGEQVEVPDYIAGHVNSCVRFLDDWQVRPVVTEAVVASRRWGYCGSFDGVADVKDGRRVIYDWKTAKSGIYGETALQLAAYAHAEVYLDADDVEQPVSSLGIEAGLGVWIRADGYTVYEMDISERTFKDYLHAVWVARLVDRLGELRSEPLAVPA